MSALHANLLPSLSIPIKLFFKSCNASNIQIDSRNTKNCFRFYCKSVPLNRNSRARKQKTTMEKLKTRSRRDEVILMRNGGRRYLQNLQERGFRFVEMGIECAYPRKEINKLEKTIRAARNI